MPKTQFNTSVAILAQAIFGSSSSSLFVKLIAVFQLAFVSLMSHWIIETRTCIDGLQPVYRWMLRDPRDSKVFTVGKTKNCYVELPFLSRSKPIVELQLTCWSNSKTVVEARKPSGRRHKAHVSYQNPDDTECDLPESKPAELRNKAVLRVKEQGSEACIYLIFVQRDPHSIVIKAVETLRKFCKHMLQHNQIPSASSLDESTCFQRSLANTPDAGPWERYLGVLISMPVVTSPDKHRVLLEDPSWLHDVSDFANFWKNSVYFQCLFDDELMKVHLCKESFQRVSVPLANARGEVKQQEFFKFRIDGATELPLDRSALGAFDGGQVDINQAKPVEFTHGLHFSQVFLILLNDARLSKAVRGKDRLSGAWVARENDFRTCDQYSGPERLQGQWIQAFMTGLTLDLKSPNKSTSDLSIHDARAYRCIRTAEGHVCTHVLLRAWPNNEDESLKLAEYHYRPPGGADMHATELFKRKMLEKLTGHGDGQPSQPRAKVPRGSRGNVLQEL